MKNIWRKFPIIEKFTNESQRNSKYCGFKDAGTTEICTMAVLNGEQTTLTNIF